MPAFLCLAHAPLLGAIFFGSSGASFWQLFELVVGMDVDGGRAILEGNFGLAARFPAAYFPAMYSFRLLCG